MPRVLTTIRLLQDKSETLRGSIQAARREALGRGDTGQEAQDGDDVVAVVVVGVLIRFLTGPARDSVVPQLLWRLFVRRPRHSLRRRRTLRLLPPLHLPRQDRSILPWYSSAISASESLLRMTFPSRASYIPTLALSFCTRERLGPLLCSPQPRRRTQEKTHLL